ncbi:hypothetical protein [Paenibacillus lautus]|uniref:hypothetical protein n=1 Tax=Paenibacillus lautus TaxID=1401 RepID=UPI001C7DFD61|nr:hypothetical protein [Paenibacillus lautus]MBX4152231.1 hypothetical protein [Paenibacillus lautus]
MRRIKTIKYICDTSVDEMIEKVLDNKADINHVIEAAKESRTEYGLKVQQFIERLSYFLDKYEAGMILEAKIDCMNNFRKGQRVEITKETNDGKFVIDDVVSLEESVIRQHFRIISS